MAQLKSLVDLQVDAATGLERHCLLHAVTQAGSQPLLPACPDLQTGYGLSQFLVLMLLIFRLVGLADVQPRMGALWTLLQGTTAFLLLLLCSFPLLFTRDPQQSPSACDAVRITWYPTQPFAQFSRQTVLPTLQPSFHTPCGHQSQGCCTCQ
jgi:hypothetical protein